MKRFKKETYKVIQWATGNQGRFALKMISERPHLQLVGCWVSSEAKAGRDAGDIAGVRPMGVRATTDAENLIAMQADCVVYSPFYPDLDLMCRILASGKSLVTQLGFVWIKEGETRDRIAAACKAGNSSFYAGGINPGFFCDRMGATLTTLCANFNKFTCVEYSNGYMQGLSQDMIFGAMGFGWTQAQLDAQLPPLYQGINDRALLEGGDFFAAALGFEVDLWEKKHDFVMSGSPFEACGRTVQQGQVAAIRNTYRLYSNGTERIVIIQAWKLHPDVQTDWGYQDGFYQLHVDGEPSFKLIWQPEGDEMRGALLATATCVVNPLPLVCDAEPGIHTAMDLPLITYTGKL